MRILSGQSEKSLSFYSKFGVCRDSSWSKPWIGCFSSLVSVALLKSASEGKEGKLLPLFSNIMLEYRHDDDDDNDDSNDNISRL